MLVKCRNCNKKIDRDIAFKVVVGGRNTYYCNEKEYLEKEYIKQTKQSISDCIDKIFGYKVINTIMKKELKEIYESFDYGLVLSYLQSNFDFLHGVMCRDFNSEYAKIRYFSAILKNNIADYRESINKKPETKVVEVDMPNMNFQRKSKRVALQDIEMEVGDES